MSDIRTLAQNRRMHALAWELEKTVQQLAPAKTRTGKSERLQDFCQMVSGQPRTSLLTQDQAEQVINLLRNDIARQRTRLEGVREDRNSRVRPAQQNYISKLLVQIARINGDYQELAATPTRLQEWCRKWLGRPWPQTQLEADVQIEALKSMLARALPDHTRLLAELQILADQQAELSPWGQRLVQDGLKRAKRWGPVQWSHLHSQFLNWEHRHEEACGLRTNQGYESRESGVGGNLVSESRFEGDRGRAE